MKKLLFFISLSFLSSSLIAQEANPNYFHDLSGFEDSTGTTQLFYRLYEPNIRECSYEDHNGETYTTEVNPYRNNLRHFDQSTNSDSIYLKDYTWDRPFCETLPYNLMSFTLVDNNISRPYSIYQSISGLTGGTWLGNIDESLFDLGIANPMAIDFDQNNNSLVISSPASELIIKSNTENNYEAILKKTYRFPLGQESLWNGKAYYDEYPDSLLIDFTVVGINPFSSSQYVGFKNDSIVTSSDRGVSYEKIVVHDLSTFNYEGNRFDKTLFDADGNTFYLRTKEIWTVNSSPNIYRVMNSQDNWSFTELLSDSRSRRMTIDSSNTGHIYLSDSTKVFFSEDYGEIMQEILEFEEEVTGLYKKPDSDILYVLTKTDLYKVENGQPTSIKQVPVSNEETQEIPNTVSLKQNYPNPFNPTTTIKFELDKSTFAKLTVYDVLGRKIRELVNEVRPAGTNTIQFDATNLASGVYLYRLEANGVVQTKRLTLIK